MARKRCRKRRYETPAAAKRAIEVMAEKFGGVVYKKAHRCAQCKAWHITSTPPRRGRRIQR